MAGETAVRFKIVDLSKVPSAEAGRAGRYDLIVTYQDAAGRMRIVTIPYEEFEGKTDEEQDAVLREYIRTQEEERLRFIGRELTI
jgi:muramidase (phage lysozyme)